MAVGAWSHDRTRHRPICPNGATHTSPGHRPGNCRIQENQCVLKEHRIGRGGAGSRSETRDYAAFLQNACFFFRGAPQGLHPGLVCDAPLGHGIRNTVDEPCIATAVRAWDSKHGGRAGYWNRGLGMGFETRWTSPVSESRSGHGIRNTMDEPGIGNAFGARYRKRHRSICPNGACLWIIEPRWEDKARGRWRLGCGSSRPGAVRRGFRQNSIFPVIL